jgi:hypothetical protein
VRIKRSIKRHGDAFREALDELKRNYALPPGEAKNETPP